MLDLILGAVPAILSGGATGLIGIALQRFFDFLNARQQLALEREKMKNAIDLKNADAAIMREEWAQRTRIAESEGQTRREVAETEAFSRSLLQEPERYATGARPKGWLGAIAWFVLALVDAIRGVIRPGLTLYLCWISTRLYEESRAIVALIDPSVDTDAMIKLHVHIVHTLLYLFTTCLTWWFGTRNKQPQPSAR